MGAYLSTPVREKISEDKSTDKLVCGVSSMQGWRVSQEVAIFFAYRSLGLGGGARGNRTFFVYL